MYSVKAVSRRAPQDRPSMRGSEETPRRRCGTNVSRMLSAILAAFEPASGSALPVDSAADAAVAPDP